MDGEGELQNKNMMLCVFESRMAIMGTLACSSSSPDPETWRKGQLQKKQE